MEKHEATYLNTPSVESVEAQIDALLGEFNENYVNLDSIRYSSAEYEACKLEDELEDWSLKCKLSSAMGSMVTDEPICSLFITLFEELEKRFTSHISSITAKLARGVSPKFLEKIWSISNQQATDTVERNSRNNRHSDDGILSRHFSTNDRMLRYRCIRSNFFTDSTFVTKASKFTRGCIMLQLFVSDKRHNAVYPMERKRDFKDCLNLYCKEVGVPEILKEQSFQWS